LVNVLSVFSLTSVELRGISRFSDNTVCCK